MKKSILILIFLSSILIAQEYKLVVEKENCTHIKVQVSITELKVRGDLGVMILNESDSLIFQSKYGNAIILKSDIIDYKEEVE